MFNPNDFIKNAKILIGEVDRNKKSKIGMVDEDTRIYFVYNYIKVKRERKASFTFVEFHNDRLERKEIHFEELRKIFGVRIERGRYKNMIIELINKPISENIKKFISKKDRWIAVWDHRINIICFYQFNISKDGEKMFCHFRTLYPFVRAFEVTPKILGKNWEIMKDNIV